MTKPPRAPRKHATRATPGHRGSGGERLAKAIARAGLASRRDAEAMIEAGRVTVNGKPVARAAVNVRPGDAIAVDGAPLPEREGARLWLYHKPTGLVTTEKDEKGRPTVFDALRDGLGRVLSVGRLDLNSEGLLLLTNDGDLKRRLELPETGWLRRYRVRVNGAPDEAALERLRAGIAVEAADGGTEDFAPMQVALDRQQGANAWLTVGLREGRNREVRRAMEAVGLTVNRLIRVSYGPFQLGTLKPGAVEELKPRVVREQLGSLFDGPLAEGRRATDADAGRDGPRQGRRPRPSGDRLIEGGRGGGARKPRPAGRADGRGSDATPRDRRKHRADGDGTSNPTPRGRGPRPGADARDQAGRRGDRTGGPRMAKPPVTRNDGDEIAGGKPSHRPSSRRTDDAASKPARPAKAKPRARPDPEREAARRANPRVSLRRGPTGGGKGKTKGKGSGGPPGGRSGPRKPPRDRS